MDTRDDFYVPTRGARHSLFVQNAGGFLGGDNYFVKGLFETSWFFPLPLGLVLNLRGKLGIIQPYGGMETPVYEKFFVGGLYTIRGFEYGRAGPVYINGDPQGALNMVVFNTELIFPLSRQIGLRGAVFWDVGKGFDRWSNLTPLRQGAGAGIRWFSPIGPIHIDFGYNLTPRPEEKQSVFDFSMGTVF
jgi:outer membrane protein insertion porin family